MVIYYGNTKHIINHGKKTQEKYINTFVNKFCIILVIILIGHTYIIF